MKTPILPTGIRIILLFISLLFINGLFQLLGTFISGVSFNDLKTPEILSVKDRFIIQCFGLIGSLLVIFFFRKYSDLRTIKSMGFIFKNKSEDLLWGVLISVLIISIGTVTLLISNFLIIIDHSFDINNLIYGFLLFTVIALNEEILCRGYILNNLMGVMNKYLALVLSSLIFALLHSFNSNLNWIGMLNLFIAGILLGSTYIYTKNLWFPISFHLFWNFIQGCVFDYNVSGLNVYSIFKFDMPIKNSFNGGDFGFEGSWLCTLLSSFAILIILYYYNRQNKPVHIQQTANI